MAPDLEGKTTGSSLVEFYADSIKAKTVLVTGASPNGLGAVFAETIAAAAPALIILAGRNASKVRETADKITTAHPSVAIKTLQLDLGSFKHVREAAETVNGSGWDDVPQIDVLVNNAGIMAVPYAKTEDGIESQFATNHLGHFLFTNLIIKKVLAASAPRIVNLSSVGHRLGHIRWTDYNFADGKHYDPWIAYGASKTANCLFSLSLAEKLGERGLLSFSLHPGVAMTNLPKHLVAEDFDGLRQVDIAVGSKHMWEEWAFQSHDQGIATHVQTAFAPGLDEFNGHYFIDCKVADPWAEGVYPWATNKIDAERLWRLSEDLVGEKFNYE
ncbi:Short-chain dehydrogenase TIC 32 [Colletotrichum sidae]|uniref:Short-chain dehydrogenase TIC 32 n=1 Tax=Colletotrichum sidae TaxID=1347389 RepID=A0A4R8TFV6_9PEZI|nr:Short-chain dehydrogenase TIC 32 [Colletotrichum sidae]